MIVFPIPIRSQYVMTAVSTWN